MYWSLNSSYLKLSNLKRSGSLILLSTSKLRSRLIAALSREVTCKRQAAAAAAKSLQSCPTLCDPRWQPTRLLVPGILQARTLEWAAISFSNAWKWKVKVKSLSHVRLLETPWTTAYQAPPSRGFFRQEYSSGVPLPSPVRDKQPTDIYMKHKKLKQGYYHEFKRRNKLQDSE